MPAILITMFETDGIIVDVDPATVSTEDGKTSRGLGDSGRFHLVRFSQEVCLPAEPGDAAEDSYFV